MSAVNEPLVPHTRTYGVKGMGIATVLVLGAAIAGNVVVTLWPLAAQRLAERALAEDSVDLLNQAQLSEGLMTIPYVGVVIAAAVMVIIWLWRARKNLDAFPEADPSMRAGWAIGGWFVPLANLVIPGRMMASVVRESLPGAGGAVAMVWMWWLGWIAGNGVDRVMARRDVTEWNALPATVRGPEDYQAYIDYFGAEVSRGMPGMILTAVAGALLCLLMWRVSWAQDARIAVAPPPAQPTGWHHRGHDLPPSPEFHPGQRR
jgi:Domain of unknown function (DUF4328)